MKLKVICFIIALILIVGCSEKSIEESKKEEQNFLQNVSQNVKINEPTCEEKYNQLMIKYNELVAEFEKSRCDKWINDVEQMKICKSLNDEAQKIASELKELKCKS